MYSGVIPGLWIDITTVEVGTVDKIKIMSLSFSWPHEEQHAGRSCCHHPNGHIYVNRFLFPFPAHDDPASDVGEYLQHPYTVLAEVKDSLGPRGVRAAFACANVCRSLAYRSGVIVRSRSRSRSTSPTPRAGDTVCGRGRWGGR
jgi:hypothetical protein